MRHEVPHSVRRWLSCRKLVSWNRFRAVFFPPLDVEINSLCLTPTNRNEYLTTYDSIVVVLYLYQEPNKLQCPFVHMCCWLGGGIKKKVEGM